MLFKVRQDFIVKHVSRSDRRFGGVEFCKRFAIRINKGLLINTTNAFEVANIKRIL